MISNYKSPLMEELKQAVIHYDTEILMKLCERCLESGVNANQAVFDGLIPGMLEVGRLYEVQEYFIPEMLMCAETLHAGLNFFQSHLTTPIQAVNGKILIGVVEGDIHDIGKNLVKMMLEIAGYDVTDLGHDVPLDLFLQTALENDFDLVCMSSMMTTTMYEMKRLIKKLKAKKPNIKIMIGGSPVTEVHATKWHADGYASDSQKALSVVYQLINVAKELQKERKY